MTRTPLLIAVLVLAADAAVAQPVEVASTASLRFAATTASRGAEAVADAWSLGVDFTPPVPIPGTVSRLTLTAEARYWELALKPRRLREAEIDWWGLLTQQTRVDGFMHAVRLMQPKFHDPLYHSVFYKGYRDALKGYYSLPLRWEDGDDVMTNDIGHPIMGAVYSYTFTDYDRRCSDIVFGEGPYWSCLTRATIYAALASANWEWNPVMSESALGHIGKFYTCDRGRCRGEGGWTDLVMTPLGGTGLRIAGDLARARLWPALDRHLAGGTPARALNYVLKGMTAPGHVINCAFKADFRNAWQATPSKVRRTR